jgi:hypothetical protein
MGNAREWGCGAEMRLAATCSATCLTDTAGQRIANADPLRPSRNTARWDEPDLRDLGRSCEPAKGVGCEEGMGRDGMAVTAST